MIFTSLLFFSCCCLLQDSRLSQTNHLSDRQTLNLGNITSSIAVVAPILHIDCHGEAVLTSNSATPVASNTSDAKDACSIAADQHQPTRCRPGRSPPLITWNMIYHLFWSASPSCQSLASQEVAGLNSTAVSVGPY